MRVHWSQRDAVGPDFSASGHRHTVAHRDCDNRTALPPLGLPLEDLGQCITGAVPSLHEFEIVCKIIAWCILSSNPGLKSYPVAGLVPRFWRGLKVRFNTLEDSVVVMAGYTGIASFPHGQKAGCCPPCCCPPSRTRLQNSRASPKAQVKHVG